METVKQITTPYRMLYGDRKTNHHALSYVVWRPQSKSPHPIVCCMETVKQITTPYRMLYGDRKTNHHTLSYAVYNIRLVTYNKTNKTI